MDFEYIIISIFVVIATICLALLAVLLVFTVQERMLMLDCLNNGGHWLTNYAIGCTYPMG